MRGKVTLQDVPCDSVGITPRVCGEKAEQIKKSSADTGSPPHVRGKETRQAGLLRAPGITPRVCGEKCHSRLSAASAEGSPPRMRGKDESAPLVVWYLGITPAYAGKSGKGSHRTDCHQDHPRVCGEKFITGCPYML